MHVRGSVKKIGEYLENHRELFVQFIKFGIVGISNTLISYITYLFFLQLDWSYIVCNILGFFVSVTNSFYWNNKYVFAKVKKNKIIQTYIKTVVSYGVTGLLLANIMLYLLVDYLRISELISPLICLIITVPLNFILNKYWTFK